VKLGNREDWGKTGGKLGEDWGKTRGTESVFRDLKKALVERVLRAELTEHLGYPEGSERPDGATNAHNGTTPKTVLREEGELPLAIPRIGRWADRLSRQRSRRCFPRR